MKNSIIYNELLEILNRIPCRDYLKIPSYYIQFLNKNKCSNINIDTKTISREAYALFFKIYYDYIAIDKEKIKIDELLKINNFKKENHKKKKYNPDEIFKNKSLHEDIFQEKKEMIEYKRKTLLQNFFYKINNLLKKIFNK